MSRNDLEKLAAEPDSAWGRLALPGVLTDPPAEGSIGGENLKTAWALIEPLIRVFKKEAALSRFNFEALIRERAEATGSSFITLKRMLFRYYYFGGTRMALLPLPPGPKPGYQPYSNSEVDDREPPKRRGRQPVLASELGVNDFVVSENDVADMVECLEQCLRKGPTFITDAHEAYLSNHFRRRNGQIYTRYLDGKCVEPVTARQYRYYVSARALLIPETN